MADGPLPKGDPSEQAGDDAPTPKAGETPAPRHQGETPVSQDRQLKGWYRRGVQHPPHFDGGIVPQFVTFRLTGTLPTHQLEAWKRDLEAKRLDQREFHDHVETYLDAGRGECWLKNGQVAELVENALLHSDDSRYELHGWVVMPNHVHVLFTVRDENSLPAILQSWKSYTAHKANRILARKGPFWQDDYFDRFIRDERHFLDRLEYIAQNPVRAGLCKQPEDWRFSFCWKRE